MKKKKKAEADDAVSAKKITEQAELIRQLKAEKFRLEKQIKSDRHSFEAEKSSLQTQLVCAKAGTAPQYQSKQDIKIKSENTTLKAHLMSHKKRATELEYENFFLKQQLSEQARKIKTLRTEKEATQTSATSPQWQYHYLACTPHLFSSSTLPEITSPMTEGEHQHLGPK